MIFRQYNPLKTDQTYFTVQLSLDKSSWPIFKINSEVGNLCLNFIHLWMEAMPTELPVQILKKAEIFFRKVRLGLRLAKKVHFRAEICKKSTFKAEIFF